MESDGKVGGKGEWERRRRRLTSKNDERRL